MNEANNKAVSMALGRLFSLGESPYQEGDMEQYDRIRELVMTLAEEQSEEMTAWTRTGQK